ncbi:hypothetical protein [Prauserella muralis]|nr:hypothetical protein [Prauserella muralis]TWE28319.1 hypothetical protein FHX69_0973 [Prauserella muralis]
MSMNSGGADTADPVETTPIFEEILNSTGISWPADSSTKDAPAPGGGSG